MDLSKFTDAELDALERGDLTKLSDAALDALEGKPAKEAKPEAKPTFGQMLKNEVMDSIPGKMLGLREYAAGTPHGIAAAAPTRFAVGAGEFAQGAVQRLAENNALRQVFPGLSLAATMARPELDKSFAGVKQMAKEGGLEGYDWAGLGGNVLSPASLAMSKVPIAAGLLGRTMQGAGAGAAGGALAPAENADQAQANALMGTVGGALLTPLIHGGAKASEMFMNRVARPISDLFTESGPMNIARNYIRSPKAVGEAQLPAVLSATRNVQDILPGGRPTVGEAVAGLPEGSPLNALQDIVAKTGGGPSAAFGKRIAEQEAAIEAAKGVRKAASEINYGKAFDPVLHPVKADAALADIVSSPYFEQVLPAVERVAKHKKLTWDTNLTEMLHNAKIGLDKKLNPGFGEVAIDNAERGAVLDVKNKLVAWLADKNSDYEVGRRTHASASKLIDDFKLRQELAAKPAQPTNLGGGVNVAEETRPHIPNLLSRPAMMLNFAMKVAGKNVEPEVYKALQTILLDPSKFTTEMSKLPPKTRIELERILRTTNVLTSGIASNQ